MNFLALLANKYVIQGAVALIVLLAAWGYGQWKYHVGYGAAENDRAVADLVAYKGEVERMANLSDQLETRIAELRDVQPKIIERYNRVVVEKPLPADCRLDDERLQHVTRAIEAANSIQLGKSVPKN